MYKYYKQVKSRHDFFLTIKYLLGLLSINIEKDEYGNKYLYAKYRYLNPLLTIIFTLELICFLCYTSFFLIIEYFTEVYTIIKENKKKGIFLGIIK